jgi:hypothetical protein
MILLRYGVMFRMFSENLPDPKQWPHELYASFFSCLLIFPEM